MALRNDIVSGGIFTTIALASLYQLTDLETGTLRSFGPAMLPTVLAWVLLACGVAMLALGVLQKTPDYLRVTLRGPGLVGLSILFFALTIEGAEFGPLIIPKLGLTIVGPITLVVAGYGSTEAGLRDLTGVGCGLTGFCMALFNDLLGMDIPVVPGVIEGALIDALGTDTVLRASYVLLAAGAGVLAMFRPAVPPDA